MVSIEVERGLWMDRCFSMDSMDIGIEGYDKPFFYLYGEDIKSEP